MAFIPTPNTASLQMVYRALNGKRWSNELFFTKGEAWDLTDLNLLALTAEESFAEGIRGVLSETMILQEIKAKDESVAGGTAVYRNPTEDNAGTLAGSPVALHTALVVTFRTAMTGRSFRGRLYHSGLVTASAISPTQWSNTIVNAVQEGYANFADNIELATGSQHTVVSYQQGNVVLAAGDPNTVVGYVGRNRMGTVRKRVSPQITL